MSNDNMGNLKKLGILVIVILVVVVGVVAITPSDTLFPESDRTFAAGSDGTLEPLLIPPDDGPVNRPRADTPEPKIPVWPVDESADEPVFEPEHLANVPAPRPEPVREPDPIVEPIIEPGAEPSRFRDVTVRKSDSLWRIAEREYGAGKGMLYRVIAAANPNVDPDRLSEGQVIRVPVDPTRGSASRSSTPAPTTAPAPSSTRAESYLVKRGDTPMGLSTKFYGTVRHYRHLLRHNGLAEANDLRAGMTIEIPPAPETLANVAPERSSNAAPSTSSTPRSSGRTYTVRKGDMLGRIAREQLGDAGRWREILELNGLDDPRELQADVTIRLPDRN